MGPYRRVGRTAYIEGSGTSHAGRLRQCQLGDYDHSCVAAICSTCVALHVLHVTANRYVHVPYFFMQAFKFKRHWHGTDVQFVSPVFRNSACCMHEKVIFVVYVSEKLNTTQDLCYKPYDLYPRD